MQIGSLIRRAALHFKDAPCLVEDDRVVSFREFDSLTDRLGNALLASGLNPGDRVGVLLPNGIDCLVAYYSLAKAGLVRVGLNTRETADNHAYKLTDSGARAVFCGEQEEVPSGLIRLGPAELARMTAEGADTPCAVDRDLEAPYRLGYTGGTTGRPKGVTLTTRGETAELSVFLMDLMPNMRPGDTFLHAAPIAHASGAFFLPALVRGVRSLVMKKFDPATFIQLAERENASLTFLVPTMLAMIMEQPSLATAKLNLQRIAYGASPIADTLLRRAEARFGKVFAQCYGQAESPMAITFLGPEDHDRTGSCGRPFSTVEVAIFDDNDNALPPGEIGEIAVQGGGVMKEYYRNPEQTAQTLRKGWLNTGDMGRIDEDGFIWLVDRKKDVIFYGGENIYPADIEAVLSHHPQIHDVAVIGMNDSRLGEVVAAVIELEPQVEPSAATEQEIIRFCEDNLPKYKRPRRIIFAEVPRSATGKIEKLQLRQKYGEQ